MIFAVLGIAAGSLLTYFIIRPRLKKIQDDNQVIQLKNSELQLTRTKLTEEISQLEKEKNSLNSKREELLESIDKTKEMADKTHEVIYQQSYDLMQSRLEEAIKEEQDKYQMAKEDAEQSYLNLLTEQAQDFQVAMEENKEQLDLLIETLDKYRSKADAAIEAARREEEKRLNEMKYRINISEEDLIEVNRLREIIPYFRNPRVLNKGIWEAYFRQPTSELVNRIIGTGVHTGIYRLVDLKNQKAYIGQAADLTKRLQQHIKCALGIDTPSNVLYKTMIADGVENFTFEVLEECSRSELNEKEAYWINFYKTYDYGLNSTRGNK